MTFDGTLSNGHYPYIGQPNKPLFDALIKLKAQGHNIILWTCREDIQLQQAVDWCKEQGLEFDAVIITNADVHNYTDSEVDTKLLYVCITRAMNTLEIYHIDELTKLLQ